MTLPDSATRIYCQNCANSWLKTDNTPQFYFSSASNPIGSMTSPAAIVALAETITFCPEDVTGRLEPLTEAMGSGDTAEDIRENPDGLDHEHAGPGDADVVHEPAGRRG